MELELELKGLMVFSPSNFVFIICKDAAGIAGTIILRRIDILSIALSTFFSFREDLFSIELKHRV